MEAYLIETLRANDIKDEEILRKVKDKKVEEFKTIHEKFDFTALYALDEADILEEILRDGYEIKYLTFTGLVNLLKIKFDRHENEDYDVEDFTITNLQLDEEEAKTLSQFVSKNWQVTKLDSGIMIQPVHKLL